MAASISPGTYKLAEEAGEERDPQLAAPCLVRYVARQPILDAHGRIHGYEMLFRASPGAPAFSGDGDSATRSVLDNAVVLGLEQLTGGLPMFVNCTAEALLNGLVLVLPPGQTVLEILESLDPTPELVAACKDLKARGYRIALDDFVWSPAWKPLVDIADYVKVDLSCTTERQRGDLLTRLHRHPARMLLERVETPADLALGKKEGFTLFQGYYFCRPVVLENRAIPPNHLIHFEILQALREEPLDFKRIGDLVKRDASLTYRLLRMVNSPMYATRTEVTSIHGALVLIGDAMFRRVATLAIASELCGSFPSGLQQMAFLRARFCEILAPLCRQDATEQYLLGILSLLPAMLKAPVKTIAESMPLRLEIRQALLGENNPARAALSWIEFYEQGRWEDCDAIAQTEGLPLMQLPQTYAESVLWAEANVRLAS